MPIFHYHPELGPSKNSLQEKPLRTGTAVSFFLDALSDAHTTMAKQYASIWSPTAAAPSDSVFCALCTNLLTYLLTFSNKKASLAVDPNALLSWNVSLITKISIRARWIIVTENLSKIYTLYAARKTHWTHSAETYSMHKFKKIDKNKINVWCIITSAVLLPIIQNDEYDQDFWDYWANKWIKLNNLDLTVTYVPSSTRATAGSTKFSAKTKHICN